MKKLIILSAIALSGLIYSSANAQGRMQNRSGHDRGYNNRAYNGNERRDGYARDYHNRGFERFRGDEHSYREQGRYEFGHYRNR